MLELCGLQSAPRNARPAATRSACGSGSAIAAALLGDPPVLMLDEPFNGLDPEGIVWMRGLLRGLADEGRAVLVSSHLMSELQDTAGHLVVVGRGRVVADTTVADLVATASGDRVTRADHFPNRGHGGVGGCRRHRRHHRPGDDHDQQAARPTGWLHCSARRGCHSPRYRSTALHWRRPTWS